MRFAAEAGWSYGFIYFERVDHRHYIVAEAVSRIVHRQIFGRGVSAPADTVNIPAGRSYSLDPRLAQIKLSGIHQPQWHLVCADVVCAYLKPGSFSVFELESVLGVPVSP